MPSTSENGFAAAYSALRFLVEAGADEVLGDTPRDRLRPRDPAPAPQPVASQPGAPQPGALPAEPPRHAPAPPPVPLGAVEAVAAAEALAAGCDSLAALGAALEAFEGLGIKATAERFVFRDGIPGTPLLILGDTPGDEDDREGRPFVGPAGQLLDRMLAAIGRARAPEDPAAGAQLTTLLPWRPPGNRRAAPSELAIVAPFVRRHLTLAAPRVVLALGEAAARLLLDEPTIPLARLRGRATVRPLGPNGAQLTVIASWPPGLLLREPARKREAWRDWLTAVEALDPAA